MYEQELKGNFLTYQVEINSDNLSLRNHLEKLVADNPKLNANKKAVITVTGIEKLLKFGLNQEKSELDRFIGYLQWTREAFREFPYSIVLWINNSIEVNLQKNAPDFWSWRKGVFRFVSNIKSYICLDRFQEQFSLFEEEKLLNFDNQESSLIPLQDLEALVKHLETNPQTKDEKKLASLYSSLGQIYLNRIETEGCENYNEELNLSIEYSQKAIALQKQLNLDLDLATSLNNLALLYDLQGEYEQAESLYVQAIELYQTLLEEQHPHVASLLDNLAGLYYSRGKYKEAEPLFLRALELRKTLLGEQHPDVATSFNNLALLYKSQGRYELAELLYFQALKLRKTLLGEQHPHVASSLNNLALLYSLKGKYEQAESLYLKALELRKTLLGEQHPYVASSLDNLARLYGSQGKYELAEPLYLQALELDETLLGTQHSDTKIIYSNFVKFLKQAIEDDRVSELSNHPYTQNLLKQIMNNS